MTLFRSLLLCLSLFGAGPALADWDGRSYDGGALRFHVYRPAAAPQAIAVVLHGCTQSARAFAERAGWLQVAEDRRLLLLAPEYVNVFRKHCFNWMGDKDWPSRARMVAEIREATRALAQSEGVDKVFFTGLSAGGAMSAVLLADSARWDRVTVLGAGIVAGIVYGCTDAVDAAVAGVPGWDDATAGLVCMGDRTNGFGKSWDSLKARLPAMARRLGDQRKRPLTVSLWHGSADPRVDPVNAVHASDLWARALGLKPPAVPRGLAKDGTALPAEVRRPYDYENSVKGAARVEMFMLRGMVHRMPVNYAGPGYRCGTPPSPGDGDDHYDDVGICAADWIAKAMLRQ